MVVKVTAPEIVLQDLKTVVWLHTRYLCVGDATCWQMGQLSPDPSPARKV
jgi:hypothetical protein